MSHVMIDLETMGVGHKPAILSIGAVTFDPLTYQLGGVGSLGQFYVCVDLTSCVLNGLDVEPDTVRWWMEQSDEAKKALISDRRQPLGDALTMLDVWLDRVGAEHIWTNGPMSDHVWLESAYRAVGMKTLMERKNGYRTPRDYRTIVEAAELVAGLDRATIPEPTVKHDALADARAQAVGVQMAFAALRSMGTAAVVAEYDEMDRFLESLAKPSEPGYITQPQRPEIVSTEAAGREARLPVFRDGAPLSQSTGLREERKAAIRAELWPLEKMSLSEDAQKAKDSIS